MYMSFFLRLFMHTVPNSTGCGILEILCRECNRDPFKCSGTETQNRKLLLYDKALHVFGDYPLQGMYIDGEPMLDPLSLADIEQIDPKKENAVRVVIEEPEDEDE